MSEEYLGVPVSELPEAFQITEEDILLLEQAGAAKKLTGKTLIAYLLALLNSHGGIKTIVKTGTEGLVDTYTITMVDGNTSKFTVTNGRQGTAAKVWIKYATQKPTENFPTMLDTPSEWIGICSGDEAIEPDEWWMYDWYQWGGPIGPVGKTPQFSIGGVTVVDPDKPGSAVIKGTAEYPVLYLSIPRGKDGRNGTGAPDWFAQSGHDGHVLNRTHYPISDESAIGELNLTFGTGGTAAAALTLDVEAGTLFKVTWNDREYVRAARDVSNLYGYSAFAFGNLSYLNSSYLNTNETFCVLYEPSDGSVTVYAPNYKSTTKTMGLAYASVEQKLDNRYLDLEWIPTKKIIGVDGPVCSLTTLAFTSNNIIATNFAEGSLVEGCIYTVRWNGTAYQAECYKHDGAYYLGNGTLGGISVETEHPFCLVGFGGTSVLVYKETTAAENITLQVVGHATIQYNTLPPEYMGSGGSNPITIKRSGSTYTADMDFSEAILLSATELQARMQMNTTSGQYYAVTNVYKYGTTAIQFNFMENVDDMNTQDGYMDTLMWTKSGIRLIGTRTLISRGSAVGQIPQWTGSMWKPKIPTEYYIQSPNGTVFRLTVSDNGALTVT